MGIVELNGDLLGEFLPGTLGLFEAANNIVERGCDPKVLLLQAELLASLEVVVGVKHGADGFGALLIGDGAFVVAIVELLKVEFAARSLAGPETKIVCGGGGVAGNGNVVSDGLDDLAAVPGGNRLAIGVGRFLDITIELDLRGESVAVNVDCTFSGSGHLHQQSRRGEETPRG